MYIAVLPDLRERLSGAGDVPSLRSASRGRHRSGRSGAPQKGERFLPQQLVWRRLPLSGEARCFL